MAQPLTRFYKTATYYPQLIIWMYAAMKNGMIQDTTVIISKNCSVLNIRSSNGYSRYDIDNKQKDVRLRNKSLLDNQ
jgi:hypothetical protein